MIIRGRSDPLRGDLFKEGKVSVKGGRSWDRFED